MCELTGLVVGASMVASGGVLILGGQWKLRDPALFRAVVRAQGLRLGAVGRHLVRVLPLIEVLVGSGAVVEGVHMHPVGLRVAALALGSLATLFTAYSTASILRGTKGPCGCLDAQEQLGLPTVARSAFLAGSGWVALASVAEIPGGQPAPCLISHLVLGLVVAAALVLGFRTFQHPIEPAPDK